MRYISKSSVLKVGLIIILTLVMVQFSMTSFSVDILNWFVFIDVLIVLVSIYDKNNSINVYFVFMVSLAIFHFGQVPLNIFGLPMNTNYGYDLYSMYSAGYLMRTLQFCLISFNLAAIPFFIIPENRNRKINECCNDGLKEKLFLEQEQVYSFGRFLFWVLVIPIIIYDLTLLTSAVTLGYAAKYTYSNGFLTSVDMYFPLAIICILAGAQKENKWKRYLAFALIRIILQMLIVGNRGPLITCLVLYWIAYHTFHKTHRVKKVYLLLAVAGATIMIPFVAVIRGKSNDISLLKFIAEYNPLSMLLTEFGSTLITPILAFEYLDRFPALFGKSYLGGLAIILPFSSSYLSGIRSFMNVGAILNPYSPLRGALGGSLFADAIINFGFFGIMAAPIIGAIVKNISNSVGKIRIKKTIINNCLLLYFSYGLILYTRGSAQDIGLAIKRTIYMIIIYLAYNTLIKKKF